MAKKIKKLQKEKVSIFTKKNNIEEMTGLISNDSSYIGFTNFTSEDGEHVINLPEWLIDLIENGKFSDLVINGRDPGITSFITKDRKNTINLPDWFIELLR